MHILLTGAGFSRNWNGWLASELIGELLGRLDSAPLIAQQLRAMGNFEETLGELQIQAERTGDRQNLETMQQAITDVFANMNRSFAALPNGLNGFSNDRARSVNSFLSRFDAIFTLNQDLLLELNYDNFPSSSYTPGVHKPYGWDNFEIEKRISSQWVIEDKPVFEPNAQPIFKLHGSVNWRDSKNRLLLVMGTRKESGISQFPLLNGYFQKFLDYLNHGNTKLMVIGYGFGDKHINDALNDAAHHHNMRLYLVNPAGLSLFDPPPGQTIGRQPKLPDLRFIGVSTRSLRSTFSDDDLQFDSFMRFFK